MKKKLFTLLTLLLAVCSGAWATDYKSASGDIALTGLSNPGASTKFQKAADGCYMWRGSSGWSYSSDNGIKTQNTTGGVVFYISSSQKVTVDIYHKDSKSSDVTARIYTLAETKYAEFYNGTNNSTQVSITPGDATASFTVSLGTTNGETKTGNATLSAGYYFLVCTGTATNIYFKAIHFETAGPSLSVDPAEADPFTYVVGNGPSDAQEFTVSLANSEKAVSATLSSTNYEMSKTENGTYSSDDITDLVDDDKVYVRLKAGLAKGTGYDGTLTFANDDVTADVVVDLSGSVTGQTYTVSYNLNGGSGDAPTQDPVEAGTQITLPAAASRDFYTFAGWKCNVDNVTYNASAEYEMTAAPTTFTAQWSAPTYSSTLDFGANAATAPAIATFLAGGNMISSGLTNNSAWENSATKPGFVGFKVRDANASIKFHVQAGKHVTMTLGSVGASFTLKKNEVSETITDHKGDNYQTVIAFDAGEEDVIVEFLTDKNSTITLNKIAIEDALASTPVKVGETGFATIGLPYATTIPEGVTAYSVSATSATAVTLSSAIAADATIPANKGFIIVATPGNYTFNQFANDIWKGDVANKLLEATGSSSKVAAAEGEFYYFAIINADKKKVGFKKCAANASLAANKAYLPGSLVPSGSNSSLEISFDGETAINGIAESEANAEAPVKVIKNGQLFIGNYNVAGARIK